MIQQAGVIRSNQEGGWAMQGKKSASWNEISLKSITQFMHLGITNAGSISISL